MSILRLFIKKVPKFKKIDENTNIHFKDVF